MFNMPHLAPKESVKDWSISNFIMHDYIRFLKYLQFHDHYDILLPCHVSHYTPDCDVSSLNYVVPCSRLTITVHLSVMKMKLFDIISPCSHFVVRDIFCEYKFQGHHISMDDA